MRLKTTNTAQFKIAIIKIYKHGYGRKNINILNI